MRKTNIIQRTVQVLHVVMENILFFIQSSNVAGSAVQYFKHAFVMHQYFQATQRFLGLFLTLSEACH